MEESKNKRNDLRPLADATPALVCKLNGTSINELMELSGVPRATLYRWFKHKNKLFCVLVYSAAAKKAMKQFSTVQIMAKQ